MSLSIYLSQGLTSRGRLGLDTNMIVRLLQLPWLQDPVDKAVLVEAIQDIVDASKSGWCFLFDPSISHS
jgi:cellobiose dehydrogenase (acceptor)